MRRFILAAGLPFAMLAAPAAAQDMSPETGDATGDEAVERFAETLSDPARQEQFALTARALTEVLLDLPLAPILQPLADAAGEIADEEIEPVDPDATLRRMAPSAADMPERIEEELPRAMDRLAGASGALADLIPALRDMSERLKDVLPPELSEPR